MRKLPIILLAILFVLGLSMQVGAELKDFDFYDDVGFSGNETLIDFEDLDPYASAQILESYIADGVTFSEGLYAWVDFGVFPDNVVIGTNYLDFSNGWRHIEVNFDPPVTRVGFDLYATSANFTVTVYRDGEMVPPTLTLPVPRTYTRYVGVVDPEGIQQMVIGTPGQYFVIDNLRFETSALTVSVDIKPGSCMNPFNIRSRGVLPVAIHGADNLDVNDIDPESVLLAGVAPVRDALEYVSDCSSNVPDDKLDLILKYDRQALVDAIEGANGEINDGDVTTLELTGTLYNGTAIRGDDVVTFLARGRHWKHWKRWKRHWKGHWKENWKEHRKEYWEKHRKEEWKEKMEEMKTEWKEKKEEMKTKWKVKGKK